MSTTDENFLQKLFINEAKPALNRHTLHGGSLEAYGNGYANGVAAGLSQAKIDYWDRRTQGDISFKWYALFFAGTSTSQEDVDEFVEYLDLKNKRIIFPDEATVNTRNCNGMFSNAAWNGGENSTIDATEICKRIDFGKCKSANSVFGNANIKNITADFSNCETLNNTFSLSDSSASIQDNITIKVSAKCVFENTFLYNTLLKELRFMEGSVIGTNGLNLMRSPLLSHDSLVSVLHALEDKSGDTSGTSWTVTIGNTNIAKLTAEEQRIASQKGWNLM